MLRDPVVAQSTAEPGTLIQLLQPKCPSVTCSPRLLEESDSGQQNPFTGEGRKAGAGGCWGVSIKQGHLKATAVHQLMNTHVLWPYHGVSPSHEKE